MKLFVTTQLRKRGFTLTELLIVVSLIILLLLVIFVNWKRQIDRGYDLQRKSDLSHIKGAFEEYFNDKGCYPTAGILTSCGGSALQPYLQKIPCDPITKKPYDYRPLDQCQGYRLLTKLGDTSDIDIAHAGCSAITGCGFGSDSNYGISAGGTVSSPGFDPGATPTPTSLISGGGGYGCDSGGICNSFGIGAQAGCQVGFDTFVDSHCCVTQECKSCTTPACFDAKNACNDPGTTWCH